MIKKDTRKTLREHYRDMSADKARKAAAARISGTRRTDPDALEGAEIFQAFLKTDTGQEIS